jgi:iron complex outermembrane receptor protein
VNFFLIYIGSYLDDETQADRDSQPLTRIEDYLTVGAQYSLRTATKGSVTVALGAMNLFDATPPHVATNGGCDSKVHDPRGLLLYAYARFAF